MDEQEKRNVFDLVNRSDEMNQYSCAKADLSSKLETVSQLIHKNSLRGPADFVMMNSNHKINVPKTATLVENDDCPLNTVYVGRIHDGVLCSLTGMVDERGNPDKVRVTIDNEFEKGEIRYWCKILVTDV